MAWGRQRYGRSYSVAHSLTVDNTCCKCSRSNVLPTCRRRLLRDDRSRIAGLRDFEGQSAGSLGLADYVLPNKIAAKSMSDPQNDLRKATSRRSLTQPSHFSRCITPFSVVSHWEFSQCGRTGNFAPRRAFVYIEYCNVVCQPKETPLGRIDQFLLASDTPGQLHDDEPWL